VLALLAAHHIFHISRIKVKIFSSDFDKTQVSEAYASTGLIKAPTVTAPKYSMPAV
jgi:hypothetical protein